MDLNLSVFSWNCQGCANAKFPCIFKGNYLENKTDIVSLLEPRVSRSGANEDIAKLNFQ